MNIPIHHKTQKTHAAAYEQALADLRYGGIGVNCWSGLVYGLGAPTWYLSIALSAISYIPPGGGDVGSFFDNFPLWTKGR